MQCHKNSCYSVLNEESYFHDAVESCSRLRKNSRLVNIESNDENSFVKEVCGTRMCWLGLKQISESHPWVWLDGSKLTYANWHAGEPNNFGFHDETVAYMNNVVPLFPDYSGSWYDGYEWTQRSFPLCEYKEGTGTLN